LPEAEVAARPEAASLVVAGAKGEAETSVEAEAAVPEEVAPAVEVGVEAVGSSAASEAASSGA
jgi:hypothetical protein